MADLKKKLPTNKEGLFFVDSTCIDCETCRILSPSTFGYKDDYSYVHKQPESKEELTHSLRALLSCPTGSIGTISPVEELKSVRDSFPILIDENVYYTGFHSEKSYGAFSYFIQRENGNVLVDSPRFTSSLVNKLEKMGGIKYMFLTHQDDIADHESFAKHFGCTRIIHQEDKRRVKAEIVIQGEESFQLEKDLLIIPTPGHTKGSAVLLYKNKYLFTGDHLAYSQNKKQLIAFRNACWYSWEKLITSIEKLKNYNFLYILPGHGRSYTALDYNEMQIQIDKCLDWAK